MTLRSFLAPRIRVTVVDMDHLEHLPRSRAVAGIIDHPDPPVPLRLHLPSVLVAGAAESGPRFAVTRPPARDFDLDLEVTAEDSAPRLVRRQGRR